MINWYYIGWIRIYLCCNWNVVNLSQIMNNIGKNNIVYSIFVISEHGRNHDSMLFAHHKNIYNDRSKEVFNKQIFDLTLHMWYDIDV